MKDVLKKIEPFVLSGDFESMVKYYPEELDCAKELVMGHVAAETEIKSFITRAGYGGAVLAGILSIGVSIVRGTSPFIPFIVSVSLVMLLFTVILPWAINRRLRRWAKILTVLENITVSK